MTSEKHSLSLPQHITNLHPNVTIDLVTLVQLCHATGLDRLSRVLNSTDDEQLLSTERCKFTSAKSLYSNF